ncbi:DUF2207 family protein [Kordiimonas sp.]|uniref:DUF2207 family protein n=1 Tax=Kordiimonas sp. TaxID=1970157 RepID=UPI003A8DD2B2
MKGDNRQSAGNRFSPPKGMTPALAHVLCAGDYNARSFGAALLGLAAKGLVSLRHEADVFTLRKADSADTQAGLSKGEAALMRSLFVAGRDVPVTRQGYLRLKAAMKAHYRGMKHESRLYLNGPFRVAVAVGATGFGIVAYLLSHARTPVLGSGLAETSIPLWSLMAWLVAALALVDLWRHRRTHRPSDTQPQLERHREYLHVAMAARLDPKFGLSGELGVLTQDHAYIVAYGLANATLDRFVHALESVSGHAPEGTSIHSAFRRGPGGRKRGWQFNDHF